MTSRVVLAVALLTSSAILAGCDESGPRTQMIYSSPHGSYNTLLDEALAGRAVLVHADFAPYEDADVLANRYADILQGTEKTLRFQGAGSGVPGGADGVRVLLLHDTPDGYSAISACQGKPYDPAPKDKRLELLAIVCDDDRRLVEVRGYLPRHDGNMRAEYDELLRQTRADVLVEEDKTPK